MERYCNGTKVHSFFQSFQKNSEKFIDMFTELNLIPNIGKLYPWSHWITPSWSVNTLKIYLLVVEKYRYNTLFYLTEFQESQAIPVQDNHETTSLDWLSPGIFPFVQVDIQDEVIRQYERVNRQFVFLILY
jgi:hypothetical protein